MWWPEGGAGRRTVSIVRRRPQFSLFNIQSLPGKFIYRPEAHLTFENWFFRNQPILESLIKEDSLWVQLLVECLEDTEHRRLRCRISSDLPEAKSYKDLVDLLRTTFGSAKPLFRRRHDIFSYRAEASHSPLDILNLANMKGDEFEFEDLKLNQFKIFLCLMFASNAGFK